MNKLSSQKIASLYHWSVRPRRENHILFTITWKLEPLLFHQHSQPLYDVTEKNWNYRFRSRCKLRFIKFVKKQLCKVHVNRWQFMWRYSHFWSFCWFGYRWKTSWIKHSLHWAQPVFAKQIWAKCWGAKHAHFSLQTSTWRDASQYAQCTFGTRIRSSWLVSRCNIWSLRSITDWLVVTNRRSITFLYEHRIISLKALYTGPIETVKTFRRWTHEISLLSKFSIKFPTNSKVVSSSLAQKSFFSLRLRNESAQRKHAKHEKK